MNSKPIDSPPSNFDKRTNRSLRCRDSVWEAAHDASRAAGCSCSVFAESALLLLARLVKQEGLRLAEYDATVRWLQEKASSDGESSFVAWLAKKGLISDSDGFVKPGRDPE